MVSVQYRFGFSSVLPYRVDAKGKKCGKGYTSANKQCQKEGGGSASKEWYDDDYNIDFVLKDWGGDRWIDQLTRANGAPRSAAKTYAREAARSFLIAQEDNERGNRELQKANKKFEATWKRKR